MKPSNVMVGVAIATALAASLGASGEVFARGRWQNVIAPRASGRARLAPAVSEIGGQREPREVEKPRPRPPATVASSSPSSSASAYSYRRSGTAAPSPPAGVVAGAGAYRW